MLVQPQTIEQWLKTSAKGDEYEYHRGNLARDREQYHNKELTEAAKANDSVAKTAWLLHERGLVSLVQRRVDSETLAYIAQRTAA